jgi:hypothetical protein
MLWGRKRKEPDHFDEANFNRYKMEFTVRIVVVFAEKEAKCAPGSYDDIEPEEPLQRNCAARTMFENPTNIGRPISQ